ncbi:MAG TPA: HepT-like ribonuclease domain-containing protein [Thermoanaerobaculia bacterium]|nr:HepT-like ribonuclease domain-containing protein [Thermoanaerobaculia bacterium]
MTPSRIDLKVVDDRLQAVTEYLKQLRELPAASRDEFVADHRNPNSAESLLRRALEALLDVTRHLLAKGHGRGALEYGEVARLAGELGLIEDAALAMRFGEMARFRNRLTHFYREVTGEELYAIVANELDDIAAVAEALAKAAARAAGAGAG